MKKFIVFCPFRNKFEPVGGSPVRIKGYASNFIKFHFDFLFLSSIKPDYIPIENFIQVSLPHYSKKLFLLHNVLYNKKFARPLTFFLKTFLLLQPEIRKIKTIFQDKIIITHQENSICYFFYLYYKIDFIYDIHGILAIQEEYMKTMNRYRKFWFRLQQKNEELLFRDIQYVNCINEEMKDFLKSRFGFDGHLFIAPDGILDIDNFFKRDHSISAELKLKYRTSEKIMILFFGEFKYFGGVQLLAEVFIKIAKEYENFHLLIIGKGQMEKNVKDALNNNNIEDRFHHIRKVANNILKEFMALSDAIVIPDLDNKYNRMIPHIKLFDSLTSGVPLVVPDFNVNRNVIKDLPGQTFFFKPGDIKDMASKIKMAVNARRVPIHEKDRELFFEYSYAKYAAELIDQYKSYF